MEARKFPHFVSRAELKRIVHQVRSPYLRVGQAVCNAFTLPQNLVDQLYEDNDFSSVVEKLWQYFYVPHNV